MNKIDNELECMSELIELHTGYYVDLYDEKYYTYKMNRRQKYYYELIQNYTDKLLQNGKGTWLAQYNKKFNFFTCPKVSLSHDARIIAIMEMENDGKLPDNIQIIINEVILEML